VFYPDPRVALCGEYARPSVRPSILLLSAIYLFITLLDFRLACN